MDKKAGKSRVPLINEGVLQRKGTIILGEKT